jgi:hypothetical protein
VVTSWVGRYVLFPLEPIGNHSAMRNHLPVTANIFVEGPRLELSISTLQSRCLWTSLTSERQSSARGYSRWPTLSNATPCCPTAEPTRCWSFGIPILRIGFNTPSWRIVLPPIAAECRRARSWNNLSSRNIQPCMAPDSVCQAHMTHGLERFRIERVNLLMCT